MAAELLAPQPASTDHGAPPPERDAVLVSSELTGGRPAAALIEHALILARRAVAGARATLYRLDRGAGSLVCVAAAGPGRPEHWLGRAFGPGEGVVGVAVAEDRLVWSPDWTADPAFVAPPWAAAIAREDPLRSIAAVPVKLDERALGVLAVALPAGERLGAEGRGLLWVLADQMALALDNARLQQETARRLEHTELLIEVGRALASTLDLTEVFRRAARAMVRALGADSGLAWRRDPATGRVMPLAGYHVPKSMLRLAGSLPVDTGVTLLADQGPLPSLLHLEDSQADPRLRGHPWLGLLPHRSVAVVPVHSRGQVVGGFAIAWTRASHRLTAEEGRLLQGIVQAAGSAVENAELMEEVRLRQGRLETLLEVSRGLARLQPDDGLLVRIARACAGFVGSPSVRFRVVQGEALVLVAQAGPAGPRPGHPVRIGEGLAGLVAASGEPLLVSDPGDDARLEPAHRQALHDLEAQAWLGVPVRSGDRVLGVLSMASGPDRGFSADDQALASAFASQAAVAMENARLYREVREASDELARTQQELAQGQKMEAVGRLAGGIAHDFNNLLTVINGRSDLLLERAGVGSPLRTDLELIRATGQRAAALTRQLLLFARKQAPESAVFSPNRVVAAMEPFLRRLIGEDIALTVALHPEAGQVRGDAHQLEQVVMNLAANARDAMPAGGRLTIETRPVELDARQARRHVGMRPGSYFLVAVTDTGCGMAPEVQRHLFEPFFTTKPRGRGTGLGLATVYGIVKQNGGTVLVYSEPGAGTTFKVYLPRVAEAAPAPEAPGREPGSLRGVETILVVEDDEGVRDLAREILEAQGYAVLEAGDPRRALALVGDRSRPLELLLTDMVMPHLSGRALAERARNLRPGLRVLYMSGYADAAVIRHDILEAGLPFVQKPFTPEGLAGRVREVLDAPSPPERDGDLPLAPGRGPEPPGPA